MFACAEGAPLAARCPNFYTKFADARSHCKSLAKFRAHRPSCFRVTAIKVSDRLYVRQCVTPKSVCHVNVSKKTAGTMCTKFCMRLLREAANFVSKFGHHAAKGAPSARANVRGHFADCLGIL